MKKRLTLSRGSLNTKSLIISRRVRDFVKSKKHILTYSPFRKEPDPNLYLSKIELYLPKITGENTMKPYGGAIVRRGKFGIREPVKRLSARIPVGEIDAVIVPGVAFDVEGYRIGYGGGFYDRFLPKTHALKIGITWENCLFKHIEHSGFDNPVDVIITERRIILSKLRR